MLKAGLSHHSHRRPTECAERVELCPALGGFGWVRTRVGSNRWEWSERARQLYGWAAGEAVTATQWIDHVDPEDRARFATTLQTCLEGEGETIRDTHRVRGRSGDTRWIEVRGGVAEVGGPPERWFECLIDDVTTRKKAELELLTNERRLRVLAQLGDVTRSLGDPLAVIRAALELLRSELQTDRCAWAEVEEDEDHFVMRGSACGPGVAELQGRYPLSRFGNEALAAHRAGRPFVCHDAESELPAGAERDMYRATGIQAVVSVPLRRQGRLVAGVAVHARQARRWRADEVDLISEFTERCWESVERARADAAVRETTERLDRAQRAAGLGTWDWNPATNEVIWSDGIYEILGLKPRCFAPSIERWREFVLEEDREHVRMLAERAMHVGGDFNIEFRIRRSDGEVRWLASVGRVETSAEGGLRMLGVNVDITQRKQVEEDLRRSEDRFRAIFEQARVSIWDEDFSQVKAALDRLPLTARREIRRHLHEHPEFLDTVINLVRVRDVNPASLRLLGATAKEELLGSLSTIFAPATRTFFIEEIVALVEGRSYVEEETALRTLQGETLHVVLTLAFPTDGAFDRVLVTLTDITQRVKAEKALKESEQRFRNLADHSPMMIWVTDETGRCVYLNRRWYEFTGQREGEGNGLGWVEAVHPDDRAPSAEAFLRANERREEFRIDYRLRQRDGEERWAIDAAAPRFGPAGEFLGYVGSVIDITERKRAELALAEAQRWLEQHTQELERLVRERTEELQATNEQLETFVYSVAHDLRSPLRSITGFSELLLEDHAPQLDEMGQRMLQRIRASSEFMDRLLLDLLAFGRTARAQMELGPVSLRSAWQAAKFQCAVQIDETQAVIDDDQLRGDVLAHEATLGQIFANLLSNALKFVPSGTRPRVWVGMEDRGGSVRITVDDNGIGIPGDQHERVFRVFERLHGSRYAGTGIGLSIVRKGAERMGGSAGVEAKAAPGARFWVELARPAGPGAAQPQAPRSL